LHPQPRTQTKKRTSVVTTGSPKHSGGFKRSSQHQIFFIQDSRSSSASADSISFLLIGRCAFDEQPFMERPTCHAVVKRGPLKEEWNESRNNRTFRGGAYRFGARRVCTRRFEQDTRPPDAKVWEEGRPWCFKLFSGTSEVGQGLEKWSPGSFRVCARPNYGLEHHEEHDLNDL